MICDDNVNINEMIMKWDQLIERFSREILFQ